MIYFIIWLLGIPVTAFLFGYFNAKELAPASIFWPIAGPIGLVAYISVVCANAGDKRRSTS